jgi:hypothetical protein
MNANSAAKSIVMRLDEYLAVVVSQAAASQSHREAARAMLILALERAFERLQGPTELPPHLGSLYDY